MEKESEDIPKILDDEELLIILKELEQKKNKEDIINKLISETLTKISEISPLNSLNTILNPTEQIKRLEEDLTKITSKPEKNETENGYKEELYKEETYKESIDEKYKDQTKKEYEEDSNKLYNIR